MSRPSKAYPARAHGIDHEGALADASFDQAALVGLDIAARDGREVEVERLGQGTLVGSRVPTVRRPVRMSSAKASAMAR